MYLFFNKFDTLQNYVYFSSELFELKSSIVIVKILGYFKPHPSDAIPRISN